MLRLRLFFLLPCTGEPMPRAGLHFWDQLQSRAGTASPHPPADCGTGNSCLGQAGRSSPADSDLLPSGSSFPLPRSDWFSSEEGPGSDRPPTDQDPNQSSYAFPERQQQNSPGPPTDWLPTHALEDYLAVWREASRCVPAPASSRGRRSVDSRCQCGLDNCRAGARWSG